MDVKEASDNFFLNEILFVLMVVIFIITILILGNSVSEVKLAPCIDGDGDGYNQTSEGCGVSDCDDANNKTFPGARELCDSADNNCVNGIDEMCINGIPPKFKVAFIGDQGINVNARSVLQLIKDEGADMVIHSGDLGYGVETDVQTAIDWDNQINNILGSDFPYFFSIGNHDEGNWDVVGGYKELGELRLSRISGASCSGSYGENSACKYQGLFFILSAGGQKGTEIGNANYIKNELAGDNSTWSVCSWHHNQRAMQVGGKIDDVGWGPYEECRLGGAIIATAHEHSYHRTKSLISMQNQTIDSQWPDRNNLSVSLGSTFVFVSGLGGQSIRDQERCGPEIYPYGCNGEWANIYTSNQSANYGVLFIEFYVNGSFNKAMGYFKDISGNVPDEFNITNLVGENPPNITFIETIIDVDLNPKYSNNGVKNVIFNLTVMDPDGIGELNDSSVKAEFIRSGEPIRSGSCVLVNSNVNNKTYQCSVGMQFYDASGAWNVNVSVRDNFGNLAFNNTTNFNVNLLVDISLDENSFSFPQVNFNDTNVLANSITNITNNGNYQSSILITGYNLYGLVDSNKFIDAANFSIGIDSGVCTNGVSLINGSSREIVGSLLRRGVNEFEEIYYCFTSVPDVSNQTYKTLSGFGWEIGLL